MSKAEKRSVSSELCDGENQQKHTVCINKYITERLGCRLTWLNITTNKRNCNDRDDFTRYLNLLDQLSSEHSPDRKMCALKNCHKTSWSTKQFTYVVREQPQQHINETTFSLKFYNTLQQVYIIYLYILLL
jgi:hypothetical protein